jgi:hypothetical protein
VLLGGQPLGRHDPGMGMRLILDSVSIEQFVEFLGRHLLTSVTPPTSPTGADPSRRPLDGPPVRDIVDVAPSDAGSGTEPDSAAPNLTAKAL